MLCTGHWKGWWVTCKIQGAKLTKKPSLLESPLDHTIPLLGTDPKDLKAGTPRDICLLVFIEAAWFILAKRWKQLKCPLMDEQISAMGSIHTMGWCSALNRKEIPTHAVNTAWLSLRTLCWVSYKYCMIPLIWGPERRQILKNQAYTGACQGWRGGRMRY